MKRLVVLGFALSLLTPIPASAGAMKPCAPSQVGIVKNGEKCVKSGIFYRWIKDNSIIKSTKKTKTKKTTNKEISNASKVETKTSTIAKPTPTPSSIATPQPSATPKPTTTTQPPVVVQKTLLRHEKIYESVNNDLSKNAGGNIPDFRIISSPTVNQVRVEETMKRYRKSLSLFSPYLSKNATMVFFSEKDKDWWRAQAISLEGANAYTGWWDNNHCPISESVVCGYGTNTVQFPLFYNMIGSKSTWNNNSLTLADHEIIHVYQKNYWASQHMNCWTTEGHANFLGLAISSDIVNVNALRSQQISMIGNIFPNFRNFNDQDWVNNIKSITADWNNCFSKGTGYSVGMLIFEYLHETYSFDKVNEMLLSFSKSRQFESAVREVFNTNLEDLYNGIGQYMVSAVKESR